MPKCVDVNMLWIWPLPRTFAIQVTNDLRRIAFDNSIRGNGPQDHGPRSYPGSLADDHTSSNYGRRIYPHIFLQDDPITCKNHPWTKYNPFGQKSTAGNYATKLRDGKHLSPFQRLPKK